MVGPLLRMRASFNGEETGALGVGVLLRSHGLGRTPLSYPTGPTQLLKAEVSVTPLFSLPISLRLLLSPTHPPFQCIPTCVCPTQLSFPFHPPLPLL